MLLLAIHPTRATASEVVAFHLFNADSDLPISGYAPIAEGARINLAALPTRNLNIVALTHPAAVGSIRFGLDAVASYRIENTPPYSLAGEVECNLRAWTPSVGDHEVTATVYALANAQGDAGPTRRLTFRVVNDAGLAANHPPVANAGLDQFTTVPSGTISLRGAATDPDGGVLRYAWTQLTGPARSLGTVSASMLDLANLPAGHFVFRLMVTDEQGMTGSDDVAVSVRTTGNRQGIVTGELKKWHPITITFDGPDSSETAANNPFLNYRLTVTFTHTDRRHVVPGYYAADGQAAESGAVGGNKWRVRFTPDAEGLWTYTASFRTGASIAVNSDPTAGAAAGFDGGTGSFRIGPTDKTGRDHRAKGALRYVGRHHLQFEETGEYFLKGGTNSPENLLGYHEFDGAQDGCRLGHRYAPHVQDWSSGDPTWSGGRGKGIIGALNYLSGVGGNSVFFITYNIDGGDGEDTWPWRTLADRDRFDCSKLDQWEIVFAHMDRLGLQLHVLTQELENEGVLDGGSLGVIRKLYYRELIARFAHHLALQWNIGEENVQSDAQRREFAQYIRSIDPYNSPIAMHTLYNAVDTAYDGLLGDPSFEATSIQGDAANYNAWAVTMRERSREQQRDWVVYGDEQGPAVDRELTRLDELRRDALWGNLMGGGAGVEWYFGYQGDFGDLTSEDWRILEPLWRQTSYAVEFFQSNVPFWNMEPANHLAQAPPDAKVLALPEQIYLVYIPLGGEGIIDLGDVQSAFSVEWYRPRQGGGLVTGSVGLVRGPGVVHLGLPPHDTSDDWVALLRRVEPAGLPGDMNGDGFRSIIGDVPPFVGCAYVRIPPTQEQLTAGDCNHDGFITIIGDVPCFVACIYGNDCAGWHGGDAGSGGFTIGGAVYWDMRNPLGSGLAGVTVLVRDQAGTRSTTSVGEQGLWWIENVPEGIYTVALMKNGQCFEHVESGNPDRQACISIAVNAANFANNQSIPFLASNVGDPACPDSAGCIDLCPNDPHKTEPGLCGCGNVDVDCNANSVCDASDIGSGSSDCDVNGIPDECQVDSDGDGAIDPCDACPTDPNKEAPGLCGCGRADLDCNRNGVCDSADASGNTSADCNSNALPDECEPDSDSDGTIDGCDKCQKDANKTVPGACGCNIADVDSDTDGTPDCNDRCPNDPHKTEPGGCGCGIPEAPACLFNPCGLCPDGDDDCDGVCNSADNCPSSPNPEQEDLDSDGVGDVCDRDADEDEFLDQGDAPEAPAVLIDGDEQNATVGPGSPEVCGDGLDNNFDGSVDENCLTSPSCSFPFNLCGLCPVPGMIGVVASLSAMRHLRRRCRK